MDLKNEMVFALLLISLLYVIQYFIFHKKGITAKGGSLSFAVFYAMLAFFIFKEFEHIDFLLLLFPAFSLLVTILQWRERDSPGWLQTMLVTLSALVLGAGIYTFWQNSL